MNRLVFLTKMNKIFVILLFIPTYIKLVTCKDVLGCGGFVKSHVQIDFSKIEVKLLTKQGILKDKINCAPTNGYYFVPLYDKGEYVLELNPPAGWSFTPTKVELNIDGKNDVCSQGKDINFVFEGFGITGNVESLGLKQGPSGIEVELISNAEVRKTLTTKDGNFFFTPVYPGKYTVRISNSKWKILKNSIDVVVNEGNTELSSGSLVVQGYEVSGKIENQGEPIKDTVILLFSSDQRSNVAVSDCNKQELKEFQGVPKPICYVKSNENGVYLFPTVPPGNYYVSPFYSEQNIYYQPVSISFTVSHNDVSLEEKFEIIGFSVTGRVIRDHLGAPLNGAKIVLNGQVVTKTDSNGIYKLEKLKANSYTLKAEFEGFLFNEETIKISPNTKLPDLIPSAYRICGNIITDKPQEVIFQQIGSTNVISTHSDPERFCEYLSPGKYEVHVKVDPESMQQGLLFYPQAHTIEVVSNNENVVTFSKLKATIFGKVKCILPKDCENLQFTLRPVNKEYGNDIIINVKNNEFQLNDLNPGTYEISPRTTKYCWENKIMIVNVDNIKVEVPTYVQTGYAVVFAPSHQVQVTYRVPGQTKDNSLIVSEPMLYCLEKPGEYTFHLKGCHSYENNVIKHKTGDDSHRIAFNAIQHTVTLQIKAEVKLGEVNASITINGQKTLTGPLPYKNNAYEIKLLLSGNDKAVIVPQSDLLYFNPPILEFTASNDCEDLGPKFIGTPGVVFKGKVTPSLANVEVTVESENFDSLKTETDESGRYSFPPLDKSKTYQLRAKKDSYILVGPDNDGNFVAHKLAEIHISISDEETKHPLSGALLSLSGGEGYRSNQKTNDEGKIIFNSLRPGDYFLRPMMKEYQFKPDSKIITVKEGDTVQVTLLAKRIAYSAHGQIISLNNDPEENIIVIAEGRNNCSHLSEEATTNSTGEFRIRGLQPYCSYNIKVESVLNDKFTIERTIPETLTVDKVVEDIFNLKLIIVKPISTVDILVKVTAPKPEHYKQLRIKIMKESPQPGVVYNSRIESSSILGLQEYNHGILIHVPPIPFDKNTYSVHLESNQPNRIEPEPEYFVANVTFKYIQMDFKVLDVVPEPDIKQTSFGTTVFVVFVIIIIYNINAITKFLQPILVHFNFNGLYTKKTQVKSEFVMDNHDIDEIVRSISNIKRKPKSKKH